MRKRIAILCLAFFWLALFVVAVHYHGAADGQRACAICQMSSLSFAAAGSDIHICQSWIRSTGPFPTPIDLPEAPLVRLDARAPPV